MLSAMHEQAADADTRKPGERCFFTAENPKRGTSECTGLQAGVRGQASGEAMYGWQAVVGTDGKGAKSVQKGTEK